MAYLTIKFTISGDCPGEGDDVLDVTESGTFSTHVDDDEWGTWQVDEFFPRQDAVLTRLQKALLPDAERYTHIDPVEAAWDALLALLRQQEASGDATAFQNFVKLRAMSRSDLEAKITLDRLLALARPRGRPEGSGQQKSDDDVLKSMFADVDSKKYRSVDAALRDYIRRRLFQYTGTPESAQSRLYRRPFYKAEMARRRAAVAIERT